MIVCPICKLEHIPIDKNTCPQCDSDLTCFKVLDAIPDEIQITENVSADKQFFMLLCIGIFVGIICVFSIFQFSRISSLENILMDHQKQITMLIEKLKEASYAKKTEKITKPDEESPDNPIEKSVANKTIKRKAEFILSENQMFIAALDKDFYKNSFEIKELKNRNNGRNKSVHLNIDNSFSIVKDE